jgi:hypothetical protein
MQAMRIRVSTIIDFAITVAIIGKEPCSGADVVLHIDYRPLPQIERGWETAGLAAKIRFEADDLTLRLDLDGADDPNDGVSQLQNAA